MTDIGELVASTDDNGRLRAKGFIVSLRLNLDPLYIAPIPDNERLSGDSPTHRVVVKPKGRARPIWIGVAWCKTLERGEAAGKPMFSISLHDPDVPEWARNIAAFPSRIDGHYRVVYNRPRQSSGNNDGAPGADERSGNTQPAAGDDFNDEVPF